MSFAELLTNRNLFRLSGYINGRFIEVGAATELFSVYNPANGAVLGQLPKMGIKETEEAITAADIAFKSWKLKPANERAKFLYRMTELMNKYKEDLAKIITLEAGKPLAEARGEVSYAASFMQFYAEEAKRVKGDVLQSPFQNRRFLALKQPVGPAALITPWNFPLAMITRKVGPALSAGCTAVLKPSEETPFSALAMCAIAAEAGLPPGVMNCLTVARGDVVAVGEALCHSKKIRKVSFTGSTNVGKWLVRESASTMKKVSMELGGNAPFIVFDDADLEVAMNALMNSKFRNAGQACIASNRVFVQEGIYDQFAQKMADRVTSTLSCGDGFSKDSSIGPLINAQAINKVKEQVKDCVDKGGVVLTGGKEVEDLNALGGFFFAPTVLTGVTKDMLPYQEETFGPLLPLIKFKTEEEAIEMANDTDFGLAAYACTRDMDRAWRLSDQLDAGMIGINEGAISGDLTPFGGVKESGVGREGGTYGIDEYLEVKFVCMGKGSM